MNTLERTLFLGSSMLAALLLNSAMAAPFQLLKDVYPGPSSGTDYYLVSDGTKLFFWGFDGVSGSTGQPWVSDGTVSGTQQIGNVFGSGGAFNDFQPKFVHRGLVYFVVYDAFTGNQLWRTDGTLPGTFAVTNVTGGLDNTSINLTPIGDVVVFEGGSSSQGYALMATDGSIAGTQILTSSYRVKSIGVVQKGRAVFLGSSISDVGLIVTDGTIAGTSYVPLPALTSFGPFTPPGIAAVNETVFFVGADGTHGTELWSTDGTQAGTALVRDIYVGSNSSFPTTLMRVDDHLFFVASTPAGQQLWVSDGTLGGTVGVKNVFPTMASQTATMNGMLYFAANSAGTGTELWRSDGTNAGTILALGDFDPGALGAFDYGYNTVQAVNHKLALVMAVVGSSYTVIPYVSDGTLAGTQPMDTAETVTVFYSGLTAANGKLFASGTVQPSNIGNELIATDAFATLGNTWCANPEEAIPDNLPAGLGSQFHLPGYGGITKLTVSVDIGHTNIGDLSIKLKHQQTGTEVVLFDRPLNSANLAEYCPGDLLDIVFDDSAGTAVQSTCVDARLAYPRDQSLQPASPLSAFDGESLAGDWTLTATDNASGDIGILHEWCMNFATDRIFADAFD